MCFGEIRIRLNRASERVARVGIFLELDENEPNAVPRHRVFGRGAEYLPVCLESEIDVLSPEKSEGEIQPSFNRRRRRLQRATEAIDRTLGVSLVPDENAKIVVRK